MKNNIFTTIVICIVIILLFIVGFTLAIKSPYSKIQYDKVETIEEGIVYFGETDSTVKSKFKYLNNNYDLDLYVVSEFDIEEVNNYLTESDVDSLENEGFIFIYKSKPVWSSVKEFDESRLDQIISKYKNGTLLKEDIKYKTVSNIEDLITKINSNKYTVFILGQKNCNYCTIYKPVFNNVVINKSVDIYYIEKESFTDKDWNKLKDLKLDIKAECTVENVAKTTADTLSYPLTMITKKGKTVDCLLGYQSEDKLVAKLGEYNIIK